MFIAQNTPFWKCQKVSLKQHQKLHIPMAQDGFNFHHETKRDTDLFLCIMLILINLISRNTLTRDVYPHKPTNSDCSTRCLSTLWWDFAVCCTFSTCRKHQEQHWHSKKLIKLLIYIYGLLLFLLQTALQVDTVLQDSPNVQNCSFSIFRVLVLCSV